MSDLEFYRQIKATEIIDIYNASIFKQYKDINKNILIKLNSSDTALQKQEQITLYIKQLYNSSKEIESGFQTDILNAQTFLPISIIDSDNLLPKKAKLIGINYINSPFELKGCWQDVLDVSSRLTQKGFLSINIITDASTSLIQPTSSNILSEIENFVESGNANDILFLMYSGHGSSRSDGDKDELDQKDEQIIGSDFTFISDDTLQKKIATKLKKDVTLVAVFDSCYSGSILDLKYIYSDVSKNFITNIKPPNKSNPYIKPDISGNVILISGSTDTQTSADANINGRPNGAMTWALLESLKNNPNITWRQLILNMRSLLAGGFYTQIPQLSCSTIFDIDKPVFI